MNDCFKDNKQREGIKGLFLQKGEVALGRQSPEEISVRACAVQDIHNYLTDELQGVVML